MTSGDGWRAHLECGKPEYGLPLCFGATTVGVNWLGVVERGHKSTTSALVARQSGKPEFGFPHSKASG